MRADDPRHGTFRQSGTERVAGCDCIRCTSALLHRRRQHKLRQMGKPSRVPTEPVRIHLERLVAAGWSPARISVATGVAHTTISELMNGKWANIAAERARAIMALHGEPQNFRQGRHGTVRRLQALAALGWPMREVCARAGLYHRFGADTMRDAKKTISEDSAQRIAQVYDELCMTLPPDNSTTRHVRTYAVRKGWAPPLAWENIDDPTERPEGWQYAPRKLQGHAGVECDPVVVMRLLQGDRIPCTKAEREEAVRRWVADGGSIAEICRHHNWREGRYSARLQSVPA